jgi:hypothetical protein
MGQWEYSLRDEQIRHFTTPRKPSDSKRESKSKTKNNSNINSISTSKNNSNNSRL